MKAFTRLFPVSLRCGLKRFAGGSGSHPGVRLTVSNNKLLGTTADGGTGQRGTAFTLNTDANSLRVLTSLSGWPDGYPHPTGLTLSGDILYGIIGSGISRWRAANDLLIRFSPGLRMTLQDNP